tara:strand:- start:16336 stop:17709 length:1374 start_codon:yes stop_codon:yes gene_type:complete
MNLSCVKIECADCNEDDYLSAGAFVRFTGKPLKYNTAAIIPTAIGCRKCASNNTLVFSVNGKQKIVANLDRSKCKICDSHIPELFFISFPNADFCPSCVADGKISNSDVLNATGELFIGEAYWKMSLQFRDELEIRLFWLREAVKEGYLYANYTLGDLLSKSTNITELQEAAEAYKHAATSNEDFSRGALYRYALMVFHGKGTEQDQEKALKLLEKLASQGHFPACRTLGNLYLTGEDGIVQNKHKAYEYFLKDYEVHADRMSMTAAATIAFMVLSGVGVEKSLRRGEKLLREAVQVYTENKQDFDKAACVNEILDLLQSENDVQVTAENARIYLNWMDGIKVPLIAKLLKQCGGKIPHKKPAWEFFLKNPLPQGKREHLIRNVCVPLLRDRPSQMQTLGQIERLPDKTWVVTTDDCVIIGESFNSEREAVKALATFKKCDAEYVDLLEKMKRLGKK